jgi:hypothetical protein
LKFLWLFGIFGSNFVHVFPRWYVVQIKIWQPCGGDDYIIILEPRQPKAFPPLAGTG